MQSVIVKTVELKQSENHELKKNIFKKRSELPNNIKSNKTKNQKKTNPHSILDGATNSDTNSDFDIELDSGLDDNLDSGLDDNLDSSTDPDLDSDLDVPLNETNQKSFAELLNYESVSSEPSAHVVNNVECNLDDLFLEINNSAKTLNIEELNLKDDFEEIDDFIDLIINEEDKDKKDIKFITCPSCKHNIDVMESYLTCKNCGREISNVSSATDEQYTSIENPGANVNDKGFMQMRIVGAYGQHRALLRSSASYPLWRAAQTLRELQSWNSNSTSGKHIPKNIIEEANAMFSKIKEHGLVYRKDVKLGVLSACLYYACYANNITKTPYEISQHSRIAEKFHSAGDRILRDLNERKIIEIPDHVDPINDYINRYMQILNIPIKYAAFVKDIINKANKEKLHIIYDSKNNTKCIGAIYLLIERVPELNKTIDKDKIDKGCDISKTTFIKYYNLICKYFRKFVPIFIKHNIPMKKEWKEDIKGIINGTVVVSNVKKNNKTSKTKSKITTKSTKIKLEIIPKPKSLRPLCESRSEISDSDVIEITVKSSPKNNKKYNIIDSRNMLLI